MKKVLFINDQKESGQMVERYFRHKGFDVISEADPYNSLSAYKDHKPKVVMIDVNLGQDIDGIDVLSRIKHEDGGTGARVIMLSGLVKAEDYRHRALLLGADDFVIKPVDPNDLLDKVQSYIADTEA